MPPCGLAEMLAVHANEVDFEIDSDDTPEPGPARGARQWIRRGWW